jgi:hypothetical protein
MIYGRVAAHFTTTQQLPNILWNQKAHYRFQKGPPLIHILAQTDNNNNHNKNYSNNNNSVFMYLLYVVFHRASHLSIQ